MTLSGLHIGIGTTFWGIATLLASFGPNLIPEGEEQHSLQAPQNDLLTVVPILTLIGFFIFGILNARRQWLNAKEIERHNKAIEAKVTEPKD